MSLQDQIVADAATVFCNVDDFAEVVTYWPRSGSPRTIAAVVIREQTAVLEQDVQTNAPVFQVHVANSLTLGISSTELDCGGDQIELAPRDGKPPERRSITEVLEQDRGMLVLQCR